MRIWLSRLLVFLAVFGAARVAYAEPIRILIAAGARNGLYSDRALAHAGDDAANVRDVFTSLGGVRGDHVLFVPEATRDTLFAAIAQAQALASGHTPQEVILVVYFSGHGDRDALHMGGSSVSIAELSPRLAAVNAALRIVVVDACRTGEPVREKGMTSEPGFTVSLTGDAKTTGTAWLYAAADGQAALESDEIGGAIFTHFWLTGLRGAADANGDHRVTLDESFAYAYGETLLRSTRSGGVLQRPEAKLQLSETSPIVLTELSVEQTELDLPRQADALYLVYAVRSQTVVAEVYGQADRSVRLILPAGRYIVQKREGTQGAAVDLILDARSQRTLDNSDFHPFSAEALALKGRLVVSPWSVSIEDSVLGGIGVGGENDLALRIGWLDTAWGIALGPIGGIALGESAYNEIREKLVGGEGSIDRFVALGKTPLLRLGVDVRGEEIWQNVERKDAARLPVGFLGTGSFRGTAWGGGLHAGLRLSLSTTFFVDVGGRILALGAKTDTGAEGRLLGGASLGFGASF